MKLIQVENIKKIYLQGEIQVDALKGVSFSIDSGEFASLVGPSGSGKTTLLNIIGTLDRPNEGKVFLEGKEITSLKKREKTQFRLDYIGFVFQFYNLLPVFTALENIEYILQLKKIGKKERRERSLSILRDMKIENLAKRFPRELSGGQQQRIAVARALVAQPKIILADEPTANLDSESAFQLLDIMQEMCDQKKTTFLFSTHDARVMQRARRLIKLTDGLLAI